ncbi:MAG: GNAT family N-acetyltransferase [Hyphomicrobiales bacterium]
MAVTFEHTKPKRWRDKFGFMNFIAQRKRSPQQRNHGELDPLLGRIGTLEVRLVTTKKQLKTAQKLRYKVFFEEMSAQSEGAGKLDQDKFDKICDHLIVIDTASGQKGGEIVGTYRLLRQEVAAQNDGFYTQGEYDVDALIARHPNKNFLELGRSCVLEKYRTKRTVELLWHGIWAYTLHYKIDVMFGCASLAGTNPEAMADQLAVLHAANEAPAPWHVRAHDSLYVDMTKGSAGLTRKAMGKLPPLIKGYLRLGAYIGDGAVVDHHFGTTDVLIVLPIENINPRYITYYGEDAGRHAA